jgi:hypothetical protein
MSQAIPENQLVITGSSGLAVEIFYTAYRNKAGQRMFLTSGLGSMGYGLSAAIGGCIGAGRIPTVCVESDGSLMLNLQELATLKALNLPIIIVVMNNGGYSSIRNTQRNYFEGRYLGTDEPSGLYVPNFVEIAKAIGLNALNINPVSIALEADTRSFQLYKSGIYTDYDGCGGDKPKLDHAVVLVGYGKTDTNDYYIMRNSWGESWGINGYMYVGRGEQYGKAGMCGLLTIPMYPIV